MKHESIILNVLDYFKTNCRKINHHTKSDEEYKWMGSEMQMYINPNKIRQVLFCLPFQQDTSNKVTDRHCPDSKAIFNPEF